MAIAEKLENLLSLSEAAKVTGIKPVTLRAMCQRGEFADGAKKIGDNWIISPEALYLCTSKKYIEPENPMYGAGVWRKLLEARVQVENLLSFPDVKADKTLSAFLESILQALEEATR